MKISGREEIIPKVRRKSQKIIPKVSVIIPVYNTALYLKKCLDSIINQTLTDIEIICVNDCSTDNSLKILDTYKKTDERIKVVNLSKNSGLSAARNIGMETSSGEFIYFLDSDDWIEKDYIEQMYNKASETLLPIIVNTNILAEFDNISPQSVRYGNLNISTNGEIIQSDTAINNIIWSACSHLYKKDFLIKNNLQFPKNYVYEDMYFSPLAYSCTEKIFCFYGPQYHYRIRQNSLCRKKENITEDKLNFLSVFNLMYDSLDKKGYISDHKVLLYPTHFLILNYKKEYDTFFTELKKYFQKIEKYVLRDKDYYDSIDLKFFEDVLHHFNKLEETDYVKCAFLQKLRKRIERKNA